MGQGMRAGLVLSGVLLIFAACAPSSHYDSYTDGNGSAGTPLPTPVPNPGTASFKAIQASILLPKCGGCHGAAVGTAGVRFNSYAGTIATVVAGSSNTSRLYAVVSTGAMPPQPNSRLSATEVSQIRAWIDAGALNN